MVRRSKNEGGDAHCKATAGATTVTDKRPYTLTAREKEALARFKAADETRGPRLKVQAGGATATFSVDHPNQAVGILAVMGAIGTTDGDFYDGLMGHLVSASRGQNALSQSGTNFMLSVVKGIEPRDQVEAMLAAQMPAVHMASMTFARRLAHVESIPQQDSAQTAFNKLARTFAAQVEALKRYRSGGEQKMTVQHVHVADGGQAIVGNVSAPSEGGGANGKAGEQPRALGHAPGIEMPAKSKRSGLQCRAPSVRGHNVCRMHGAGGGARKGNRNALKHGASSVEPLALKRQITALARLARETMAAIE